MKHKVARSVAVVMALLTNFLITDVQPQNIACIGNGRLAVYENKADVIQVFGPQYSAPSVLEMKLDKNIEVTSQREKGTAIWKHTSETVKSSQK